MDNCKKLHAIVQEGRRFRFENGRLPEGIPLNGIYLLFEDEEVGHDFDRIVRVGTHTGDNRLPRRIRDHFINPQKDSSIFRKHLGRCFVMIDGNPHNYLPIWNIDFKKVKNQKDHGHLRDMGYEESLENRISLRIQSHFSFVCIMSSKKDERLDLEGKIISTVNNCMDCRKSDSWLGNEIPDAQMKIKQSGLWLMNKLNGRQLSERDVNLLEHSLVK